MMMNRVWKITALALLVIGLIILSIGPALAYTNYSKSTCNYSYNGTYGFYLPGSYSTKYGQYYKPTIPTSPVVKKPTNPQPTVPTVPTKPQPTTPTTPPVSPAPPAPNTGLTAEESKMVNLVNQERLGQGVKPLSVNMQLVNLARLKSQDMVKNNYFDHNSPTYGSPFDMMQKAGIKYSTAGENIAGAATTESAHQNLMNSPGHRANILNPSFNQIGIGIAQGSMYGNIFSQMFIGN